MATKHIITDENHLVNESTGSAISVSTACHIEGVGHIDSSTKYDINDIDIPNKTLKLDTTVDKTAEFTTGVKIYVPNYPGGGTKFELTELTVASSSWDATYTQVIVNEDCQDISDNSNWIVYLNDGSLPFGYASHTEGENCTTTGDYAHTEGQGTTASGYAAHAEGYATTASGMYSHAEGYRTTAIGDGAHAEGNNTTADGSSSHAEGASTKATGQLSHAAGWTSEAYMHSMYAKKASPFDKGQYGNLTIWCETTDANKTNFQLYNTQWISPLRDNTIYSFRVFGVGVDASGNTASYTVTGIAKKIANNVTVTNIVVTELSDDFTITGMSAEANDAWKALVITATGKKATTIKWEAFVEWVEITFL